MNVIRNWSIEWNPYANWSIEWNTLFLWTMKLLWQLLQVKTKNIIPPLLCFLSIFSFIQDLDIQDLDFTRELHNKRLRLYTRVAWIFSIIALINFPLVFQPRKTLVTDSNIVTSTLSLCPVMPDIYRLHYFPTYFLCYCLQQFSSLTRLHEILQFSSLTRL